MDHSPRRQQPNKANDKAELVLIIPAAGNN